MIDIQAIHDRRMYYSAKEMKSKILTSLNQYIEDRQLGEPLVDIKVKYHTHYDIFYIDFYVEGGYIFTENFTPFYFLNDRNGTILEQILTHDDIITFCETMRYWR